MSASSPVRLSASAALALLAAACTTSPQDTAVYKVGQPYEVNGTWYYPQENPTYDETGLASWYGAELHGNRTASGERFDKNALTAAHPTLPMPVNVRVTNLDNGRSVVVRVNDRGPFIPGRIIDVSQKAAQLLGFQDQGVAKVRVSFVGEGEGASRVAQAQGGRVSDAAAAATPKAAPTGVVAAGTLAPPSGAAAAPTKAVTMPTGARRTEPLPGPEAPKVDGSVSQVAVPPRTDLFIQVGAFVSEANAKRLRDKLSDLGRVSVSRATIDGKQYFRVRVGPAASVPAADALLKRVLALGYKGAAIIVE